MLAATLKHDDAFRRFAGGALRTSPHFPSEPIYDTLIGMRIINLNPDSDIGASGWFADLEGNRILMDAGIHPKRDGREALPMLDLIKNEDVDAIANAIHKVLGSIEELRGLDHKAIRNQKLGRADRES